jgi:HEAT repeat protein
MKTERWNHPVLWCFTRHQNADMQENRDNPSTTTEPTDVFSLDKTVELLSFRALHDNDPMTRKHSVYLLGHARDPQSIDPCIQAMKDPEKAVRGQASRALAEIGEPASERLITLLKDPDWKIRYRAAEALGTMEEKRAVSPLIGLLSDEKDHVRYMAVKSLRTIGDIIAWEPIIARQQDENPFVRRMADTAVSTWEKK